MAAPILGVSAFGDGGNGGKPLLTGLGTAMGEFGVVIDANGGTDTNGEEPGVKLGKAALGAGGSKSGRATGVGVTKAAGLLEFGGAGGTGGALGISGKRAIGTCGVIGAGGADNTDAAGPSGRATISRIGAVVGGNGGNTAACAASVGRVIDVEMGLVTCGAAIGLAATPSIPGGISAGVGGLALIGFGRLGTTTGAGMGARGAGGDAIG